MKIFIFITLLILFVSTGCQETEKKSSTNKDTMTLKKDTAIKRSDTAGYNK